MGIYNDRFLPRFIDVALGRSFDDTRARVAAGLAGHVVEIGFGSGRNVRHYPPAVTRVSAIEPSERARQIAEPRVAASEALIEFIGLDGEEVPLPDESVDAALVTWTLCTIPNVTAALREVRRVLTPGGTLHFVEHGRSDRPASARWQRRINPVWGKVFGGCHLDRPIPELINASGLVIEQIRTYRGRGPEAIARMYEGVAVKPA